MNATSVNRTATGTTRVIVAGLLALLAATALSLVGTRPASAATLRHWTGRGSSPNWTNPANWGGSAPQPGDNLSFGVNAVRNVSVNDFPADTSFGSLVLGADGLDLRGNRVRLTAGVTTYYDSPAPIAATLSLSVLVANDQTFTATEATHTVTYKGGLVLTRHATFEGKGTQVVTGPVTGAGAINSYDGHLTLAGTGTSTSTGVITISGGIVTVAGSYPDRPVKLVRRSIRSDENRFGGLQGYGTVGPVTADNGFTAPRTFDSVPKGAVINVHGDLTMSMDTSHYRFIANSGSFGRASSQLTVSGKVTLASPVLVIGGTGSKADRVGEVFTIIKNNGPAAVSGTFEGMPEGAVVTDNDNPVISYRISYRGGAGGRDVTLTLLNWR